MSALFILWVSQKHYMNLVNEKYAGSFIALTIEQNEELKDQNILDIHRAILISQDTYIVEDSNLCDHCIVVSEEMAEYVNQTIPLKVGDKTINADVIKTYKKQKLFNGILISSKLYQELNEGTKENTYLFNLKYWSKWQQITKKLENKYHKETMVYLNQNNQPSYEDKIKIITTFMNCLIALWVLVFAVILVNIASDEKKIHKLYTYLGYSKRKIKQILIAKYMILLIIAATIMGIIYFIINNLPIK